MNRSVFLVISCLVFSSQSLAREDLAQVSVGKSIPNIDIFDPGSVYRAQLSFGERAFQFGPVVQFQIHNGLSYEQQAASGMCYGQTAVCSIGDAYLLGVGGSLISHGQFQKKVSYGFRGDILLQYYASPMDEEAFQSEVIPEFGGEPSLGLSKGLIYLGAGFDLRVPISSDLVGALIAIDAGFNTGFGPSIGLRLGFYADSAQSIRKQRTVKRKGDAAVVEIDPTDQDRFEEAFSAPVNEQRKRDATVVEIDLIDEDLFEEAFSAPVNEQRKRTRLHRSLCESPSVGTLAWINGIPAPLNSAKDRGRAFKVLKQKPEPTSADLEQMIELYLQQAIYLQKSSAPQEKIINVILRASALCRQME